MNFASLKRSQILSSFVSAMFPLGASTVQMSFLGSWLWHVPPRFGCNPALDSAAVSLALAFFAGASLDKEILWKAELSYAVALRNLAIALADRSKQLRSEVVCAALLLEHYEVCAPRPQILTRAFTDSPFRLSSMQIMPGSGMQEAWPV